MTQRTVAARQAIGLNVFVLLIVHRLGARLDDWRGLGQYASPWPAMPAQDSTIPAASKGL